MVWEPCSARVAQRDGWTPDPCEACIHSLASRCFLFVVSTDPDVAACDAAVAAGQWTSATNSWGDVEGDM